MRHENESTMMPPTRGPMMVSAAVAADHNPKARARASPWKLAVMSDSGPGTSRAPAAPWNSRKTMSHSMVGRKAAQRGREPERGEADDEDPAATVSVGQRAREDEERGQGGEIAAGDVRLTLERADLGGRQVGGDGRQRDVHDGRVQEHDARRQDDGQQDPASLGPGHGRRRRSTLAGWYATRHPRSSAIGMSATRPGVSTGTIAACPPEPPRYPGHPTPPSSLSRSRQPAPRRTSRSSTTSASNTSSRRAPGMWSPRRTTCPRTRSSRPSGEAFRTTRSWPRNVATRRIAGAGPAIGSGASAPVDDDHRIWVIDPLDGTVNYAAGIPHFCTSVGLVVGGRPTVGVVLDPMLGDLFSAVRGQGARMGDSAIHASRGTLGDGVISLALPQTGFARRELAVQKAVRVSRSMGSAALALAWVGNGRFDAFVQWRGLSLWDIAAAGLIAAEGGATVTSSDGGTVVRPHASPRARRASIAAPASHHATLLALLRSCSVGPARDATSERGRCEPLDQRPRTVLVARPASAARPRIAAAAAHPG